MDAADEEEEEEEEEEVGGESEEEEEEKGRWEDEDKGSGSIERALVDWTGVVVKSNTLVGVVGTIVDGGSWTRADEDEDEAIMTTSPSPRSSVSGSMPSGNVDWAAARGEVSNRLGKLASMVRRNVRVGWFEVSCLDALVKERVQ